MTLEEVSLIASTLFVTRRVCHSSLLVMDPPFEIEGTDRTLYVDSESPEVTVDRQVLKG